jgi:hypothetical protein
MGRMIRPKMEVLPESALTPPARYTHVVVKKQPYYASGPDQGAPPEGHFPAGAKVRLLEHDGGPMCRVANEHGMIAMTAFGGLRLILER